MRFRQSAQLSAENRGELMLDAEDVRRYQQHESSTEMAALTAVCDVQAKQIRRLRLAVTVLWMLVRASRVMRWLEAKLTRRPKA